MKRFKTTVFLITLICVSFVKAQTGIGTSNPDESALLDLSSDSKGLLLPRLTSVQRDGIQNPAKGLIIFNTTTNMLETNTGTTTTPEWTGNVAGANENIFNSDGFLESDRVVDMDDNDLTFVTGGGRFIIDGTVEVGAMFVNLNQVKHINGDIGTYVVQDEDMFLFLTIKGGLGGNKIQLPDPALYPGRVIHLRNASVLCTACGASGYTGQYDFVGTYQPHGIALINNNRYWILISDGTKWLVFGQYP